MRPPHVTCALFLNSSMPCIWNAGAALATRDVWGRWRLLGLGVRGPGCGAPSRYLDMMSYYPWIEDSLSKFTRITISKISDHKYVMRSGGENGAYQRFGNCDSEEKINLVYRDAILLRTDNNQFQFLTYNMSIHSAVEYSCLTLQLVNASAASEMKVVHKCPRYSYGPACYRYKGTTFAISVHIMFTDKCSFEMAAWGWPTKMKLLDIQEWKWAEGTYYKDFTMKREEYRGPTYQTLFGYEPLDMKMWVPEYDVWRTTEPPIIETPPPAGKVDQVGDSRAPMEYIYRPTTHVIHKKLRQTFKLKKIITTSTTTTTSTTESTTTETQTPTTRRSLFLNRTGSLNITATKTPPRPAIVL